MKIFAAGDLHNDSRIAERLAKEAQLAQADLVVLCGDLTDFDGEAEGIVAPFKDRNLKIALIPGNHDSEATAETFSQVYDAVNLHGYSLRIGDVGFFGCGGGSEIGPILALTDEDIYSKLKEGHENIKDAKVKVMVTHTHPAQGIVEKISFAGSNAIHKAIQSFKPHIHLCGHIHEGDGIEEVIDNTKIYNVGVKGRLITIKD